MGIFVGQTGVGGDDVAMQPKLWVGRLLDHREKQIGQFPIAGVDLVQVMQPRCFRFDFKTVATGVPILDRRQQRIALVHPLLWSTAAM